MDGLVCRQGGGGGPVGGGVGDVDCGVAVADHVDEGLVWGLVATVVEKHEPEIASDGAVALVGGVLCGGVWANGQEKENNHPA